MDVWGVRTSPFLLLPPSALGSPGLRIFLRILLVTTFSLRSPFQIVHFLSTAFDAFISGLCHPSLQRPLLYCFHNPSIHLFLSQSPSSHTPLWHLPGYKEVVAAMATLNNLESPLCLFLLTIQLFMELIP